LLNVLSVSFSSLRLSSLLPLSYSPFPFFMDSCNGRLLQLIECIESMKSDVKRKMMVRARVTYAPKSLAKENARTFFAVKRKIAPVGKISPLVAESL